MEMYETPLPVGASNAWLMVVLLPLVSMVAPPLLTTADVTPPSSVPLLAVARRVPPLKFTRLVPVELA